MGRTSAVVIELLLIGSLLIIPIAAAQDDYESRRCARIDPSDPCYRDLAVSRNDAQICRLIESVSTRNSCYAKVAQNTGDKTLCLNIRKERGSFEDKLDCYEDFITGSDDRDFCMNDLKGDEKSMDACLLRIALMQEDAALCDDLFFEEKQMECITKIATGVQDESMCSLLFAKIDLSRCKSQDGQGCGTRQEIDNAIDECQQDILLAKRKAICHSRSGEKEINLDEGEEQDLSFRGHDDAVNLKYKSASRTTYVGVFDVTVGGRTQEMTLQPGMTGEHRFVNVYMIDILERGTEEAPEEPRLSLCVYADPAPKVVALPDELEQEMVQEQESLDLAAEEELSDDQTPKDTGASSPQMIGHQPVRPSFFGWLGGIARGIGSFLKKILI